MEPKKKKKKVGNSDSQKIMKSTSSWLESHFLFNSQKGKKKESNARVWEPSSDFMATSFNGNLK